MNRVNLEAYFERIRYDGPAESTVDVLRALHEAHLAAIPFENLDILLGRAIVLDVETLQRKLVAERRGGYCFEQNTFFSAVLESLGFRVTPLAARVRVGTTSVRARTHMLLRVDVGADSFVVDVGFGADGPLHPLPLEVGVVSGHHRLRREKDVWVLEGTAERSWMDLYAFTLEPHYPVDFEMANYYTSTHPESPFVQNLTAQRNRQGERAILRNRELVVSDHFRTRATETVRDPEHLLEILELHFRLRFPAGTRFARPPF
ncbi:MAG TPA: arylamine N-acetyltransferase [Vicinamibacteria bacterium]|nr:arylamine N-acetyltransferase [Vicinamibacteria bacterium]